MKMIAHGLEHTWSSVPATAGEGVIRKYFRQFSSRTELTALLMCWFERSESRRHLASLDERLLKDIGLTTFEVEHEIKKTFWQQ